MAQISRSGEKDPSLSFQETRKVSLGTTLTAVTSTGRRQGGCDKLQVGATTRTSNTQLASEQVVAATANVQGT